MSNDFNNVALTGHLVRDVELRYTPSGKAVCEFSIANNQDFGDKKNCYFFNVVVWGQNAENCSKYLDKGSKVLVSGSLVQNTWTDKQGQNRSNIKVNASMVQFLSSPKNSNSDGTNYQSNNNSSSGNYQNSNSGGNNNQQTHQYNSSTPAANNYQNSNSSYNNKVATPPVNNQQPPLSQTFDNGMNGDEDGIPF